MKKCNYETNETLNRYLFHKLSEDETTAFQFHMLHCIECANKVADIRQFASMMAEESAEIETYLEETKNDEENIKPDSVGRKVFWITTASLVAASILLAALYLSSVYVHKPQELLTRYPNKVHPSTKDTVSILASTPKVKSLKSSRSLKEYQAIEPQIVAAHIDTIPQYAQMALAVADTLAMVYPKGNQVINRSVDENVQWEWKGKAAHTALLIIKHNGQVIKKVKENNTNTISLNMKQFEEFHTVEWLLIVDYEDNYCEGKINIVK